MRADQHSIPQPEHFEPCPHHTLPPRPIAVRPDAPLLQTFKGMQGRIGILGGTFDPIQLAHLELAKVIREIQQLDTVVLIPAKQNPFKEHQPIAGDEDRLAMICVALENTPGLYASPIETQRSNDTPSYTVDTIAEIRSQVDANAQVFFLLGSDGLPSLHLWNNFERMWRLLDGVIPFHRDGFTRQDLANLSNSLPAPIVASLEQHFVDHVPQMNISSTQVRGRLSSGDLPHEMLAPEVLEYITHRGLYVPHTS